MRTTLDLPDEILKKAKVAAIERGSTLREVVAVALARELGIEPAGDRPKRVQLPFFRAKGRRPLELDDRAIARIEDDDVRRRSGLSR